MEGHVGDELGNLFSEKVVTGRGGGKRTYFFDVKATSSNDYYITITESKRVYHNKGGGGFSYEKHKLFLYKENFDKFAKTLDNTINHVKKQLLPDVDFAQFNDAEG